MNIEDKEDQFIEEVKDIAKQMSSLYDEAEIVYTSAINDLIERKSRDIKEIEHLLDGLLGFACNEKMLMLYRKLCKYCYSINPQVAVFHINAYKKMWDEDEELFKSGYFREKPIE